MKLAVFNVENLFDRAKVMNAENWATGKDTLAKFAQLDALLGEDNYTTPRKGKMIELLVHLGLEKSDDGPDVILRRNRGALVSRPKSGGIIVTANGRADWVGSLELKRAPIDHESMLMTARVIRDVDADILAVVEADSRPTLKVFNDKIVKAVGGDPYASTMVIDGNDARGIDVGIALRQTYSIDFMRSHVQEMQPGTTEALFSRDCAEYFVMTPTGETVLVIVNHFKSKGYGSPAKNDAKRKAQAQRVREIYDERLSEGYEHIAVVGDFNDTPTSDPLGPLLKSTSLKDVFVHPQFDDGGYPGTYGLCNGSNKIDYLMLSPKLFESVVAAGIWRKGMWPGSQPVRWETYPELTEPVRAGSDHACLWVEIQL